MRPPAALRALVERFDPEVFDAPDGDARLRLVVTGGSAWDAVLTAESLSLEPSSDAQPDSELRADGRTWAALERNVADGFEAFGRGDLVLRRNLHLAVAFLAASSGSTEPGRMRFHTVRPSGHRFSVLEAGTGEPLVMLHGLGGTKSSFLPTVAALSDRYRTIAVDLPGFGDSGKPVGAAYDPAFYSRSLVTLLDEMGLERVHLLGHSMGGRAALELAFDHPDRVSGLILMTPSLAWLRERPWARYLRYVRPELGLLQAAPRSVVETIIHRLVPGAEEPWVQSALDEFLRAYVSPRGRAAFYAAARNIYLEDPDHFWTRLGTLDPQSLFVWGRNDEVVPIGFARHVRKHLPHARHVELSCGHVPQVERPVQLHAAIDDFLRRLPAAALAPAA